jgi:hypothetical protein
MKTFAAMPSKTPCYNMGTFAFSLELPFRNFDIGETLVKEIVNVEKIP